MGRGVSYPSGARVAFDTIECDCGGGCDCWDYYREGLENRAFEFWPSLSPCNERLGREDLATLSNNFAYFGVSEYCGCVSIWLAPRRDLEPGQEALARRWIDQAARKLETLGTLRKIGTASNGESFYIRKA